VLVGSIVAVVDYWDNDFDKDKNCDSEDIITKLLENNKSSCAESYSIDKNVALKECQADLQNKLSYNCIY